MSEVCSSKRFEEYQAQWLVQTQQMQEIRTLITAEEQGLHQMKAACSYLRKVFFERNRTEPEQVSVDTAINQSIQNRRRASIKLNDEDY